MGVVILLAVAWLLWRISRPRRRATWRCWTCIPKHRWTVRRPSGARALLRKYGKGRGRFGTVYTRTR